jgi:hypothetical protein
MLLVSINNRSKLSQWGDTALVVGPLNNLCTRVYYPLHDTTQRCRRAAFQLNKGSKRGVGEDEEEEGEGRRRFSDPSLVQNGV